jgi:DNA polymerase III epsilon subunit-like protein
VARVDFKMIVVDLEMSGLDSASCGVWQIGAIDLTTNEIFFEEGRIDDEDLVETGALKVIKKTEAELRDKKKQSQKNLIKNFFKWVLNREKVIVGEVPQLDVEFLTAKARKYKLDYPFHHRTFDLHTIAQTTYYRIHKKFLFSMGHSDLGTTNIMKFVGVDVVDDNRAHNAIEDCRFVAECFSRLIYGRNLIKEYSKFKIPDYLLK